MTDVEYLTTEDLLRFTRALGAGPVRDVGLLESAVARPATSVFGADAYPDLELKAAALMHSLGRNHALVDGNKRLCLLAGLTFLRLNGHTARWSQDEAFSLVMGIADGSLDLDQIAARLRG